MDSSICVRTVHNTVCHLMLAVTCCACNTHTIQHPSDYGTSSVGISRFRRTGAREPCCTMHRTFQVANPNGQRVILFLRRGFPYREIDGCIVAYLMQHKTPSTEIPSTYHLSPTMSWGPTLPRPLRDFADRESKMQSSSGVENPEMSNSDMRDLTPRVPP
jgi:hypothetical protein